MSMRISSLCLLLALTACGARSGEDRVAGAKTDDRIDCALGSGSAFTHDCAIERSADGKTLTIRHADGGFRKFALSADGKFATADGADAAVLTRLPNQQVEISIGNDRYHLPQGK